jgi:hypothetical protein
MTDWTTEQLAAAKRRLRRHWDDREAVRMVREKLWLAYLDERPRLVVSRRGRGRIMWPVRPQLPDYPPWPDDLRSIPCSATTRTGAPCKITDLYRNGRCKFHGGASTGPRSPEGLERAVANLLLRWTPKPPPAREERSSEALLKRVKAELKARGVGLEPHGRLRKPNIPVAAARAHTPARATPMFTDDDLLQPRRAAHEP